MADNSTLKQIDTLKNLPTLPHILLKLIQACGQDGGSLKEISYIVEKDPSITVKILRLVNSAYFGLPKKVENIDQAVTLVGTDAVKNIAVCASVHEAFSNVRGNRVFNLKLFWWHSLKCAVLSRLLSQKTRLGNPEDAFLAGLLHDIGKLVLWTNFPEAYEALLKTHRDQDAPFLAAERGLAAGHCEIGAWLLDRWKFKPFLADAVLYHHEPLTAVASALPLVQLVWVANALAREPVREKDALFSFVEENFRLNADRIEALLSLSEKETRETADSLQIEIERPERQPAPATAHDLGKKEALKEEVERFSLLFGTLHSLLTAEDQEAMLNAVQQGLQLLFDVNALVFFLYDPEKKGLIGKTAPEDLRFAEIQDQIVPLQMEKSLLVSCLLFASPLDSFSPPRAQTTAILDEQIRRLLGKQGLACLPMIARNEYVGVIVIGLDRAEQAFLFENMKLLKMFAGQAALALQAEYQRRSRLEIIQSERIRASSAMARKVYHEVNNPLGIIKNYLKILGNKLARQDIAQDEIRIVNEEIDRVAHILRELSDFSKQVTQASKAVDVNLLISDIARLTEESLEKKAGIQLMLDLAPSLPPVMAESGGLKQVFINLIKNAAEAMPEGGRLTIQTRHKYTLLEEDAKAKAASPLGFVEISVSDQGTGIPEDIKTRLFEPYTSSKSGPHIGLGLSIVHNIVKTFGGSIRCENRKDKGAVFKIELPVTRSL